MASQAALAQTTSGLLGRAILACQASGALGNTVLLELEQEGDRMDRLVVRVCDDGEALPENELALSRVAALVGGELVAPCFEASSLLLRTASLDDSVIRCYTVHCPVAGQPPAMVPFGAEPKHPAAQLVGTQCTLVLVLGPEEAWGLGSAHGVVACLEQLLGMLRVLAPAPQLIMRLKSVWLQVGEGEVEAVSGSKRVDRDLDPGLAPLDRLQAGLLDEFASGAPAAAGGGGGGGGRGAGGVGGGEPAGERGLQGHQGLPAGPASQQHHLGVMATGEEEGVEREAHSRGAGSMQTFIGVGQAGWVCGEGASGAGGGGQAFRGSKWAAQVGIVLRVPDHGSSRSTEAGTPAAAAAPQAWAAPAPGSQLRAAAAGAPPEAEAAAAAAAVAAASSPAPTPVYLFKAWALQLGAAQQAVSGKALERCDWGAFGFAAQGGAVPGASGVLSLTLCCAQPASGARVEAVVVHLQPSEVGAEAGAGRLPALTAASEARMLRGAVEAALQHLKQQCPAVVASRRERSLMRALPALARAVAAILDRSPTADEEGHSLQAQACALVGCPAAGLERAVHGLLHQVAWNAATAVPAALEGAAAASQMQAGRPS